MEQGYSPETWLLMRGQLRHLIVKNGKVVERIAKHGKIKDSEIGLGGLSR